MRPFALLALLTCSSVSLAQCSNGSCSAPTARSFRIAQPQFVSPPVQQDCPCPNGSCPARTATTSYSWLSDPDGSGKHYLFEGPKHIGTLTAGVYRRVNLTGEWAVETPPVQTPDYFSQMKGSPFPQKFELPKAPVIVGKTQQVFESSADEPIIEQAPPPRETDDLPAWMKNGVDTSKVNSDHPEFSLNGISVSRKKAFEAMSGSSLTDDSKKRFVTAVGDADYVKAFRDAWKKVPDSVKDQVHSHAYLRTDYQVIQSGLADGISIQDPPDANGKAKVRSRFREVPTAEQLTEAVRKADPNYKPDADPDPLKPVTPASPNVGPSQITFSIQGVLIGAGIAGVVAWLARKK